jgi:hypothetical protein
MRNLNNSKSYHINIIYGEADLNSIINDFAKQTIQKNVDEFIANNYRVKKIQSFRRAL